LHDDRAGEVPVDTEFRIVLSCSESDAWRQTQGSRQPSGSAPPDDPSDDPTPSDDPPPARLARFDFRRTAAAPMRATLSSSATQASCAGERPQVYAVPPLPNWSNAFAVGLETPSAPVGLLEYDRAARIWRLELASDDPTHHADGHVEPRSERLPLAP